MRRAAGAAVCLLALCLPARGAGPEALDPVHESVVRVEALRNTLLEAAFRPDPDDFRRVVRGFESLEGPLSATPYRGVTGPARRRLESEAEGKGGMLARETALGLKDEMEALSTSLRRLMLLRHRHPGGEEVSRGRPDWRERLERILDEESLRFDEDGRGFLDRLMDRLQERIFSFLSWLFSLSPDPTGTAVTVRLILTGALMVAAFLLGGHLLRRVRARRAAERTEAPRPAPSPLGDPARHWRRALEAASRGRWETAVREGYLHVLLVLEELGVSAGDGSRTNGEVLQDLRRVGPGEEAMRAMAGANRVFDRTVYGGRPCGGDGWKGFRAAVETVVRALGREAA